MTNDASNTAVQQESTPENDESVQVTGTDVALPPEVVQGEVVDSPSFADMTDAARRDAIAARVREMSTAGIPDSNGVVHMTVEDRDAILADTFLTRDAVVSGNVHVSDIDAAASIRFQQDQHVATGQSLSYQRALLFLSARDRLFGSKGLPYPSAKAYVTDALGTTENMVTTLQQEAVAIELGVEDKSTEWKHLVQNANTRKAVRQVILDARKAATEDQPFSLDAVKADALAILAERVRVNPKGDAATDKRLRVEAEHAAVAARKAAAIAAGKAGDESGESNGDESTPDESTGDESTGGERGAREDISADKARGELALAVQTLRKFFPHASPEVQRSTFDAVQAEWNKAEAERERIAGELSGETNGSDAAPVAPVKVTRKAGQSRK